MPRKPSIRLKNEPFKPKTPKSNTAMPKVVGVATRVVEDDPAVLPVADEQMPMTQIVETEKDIAPVKSNPAEGGVSNTTYKVVMWLIGIAVALFLFVIIMKNRQSDTQPYATETAVEEELTLLRTVHPSQQKNGMPFSAITSP